MRDGTRRQLSQKMKQKWKDPDYRRQVTESLKVLWFVGAGGGRTLAALPWTIPAHFGAAGACVAATEAGIAHVVVEQAADWLPTAPNIQDREIWNTGRPHDADTRLKMSEAKQGKPLPIATRRRMSSAAMGHTVSPETRAAVGDAHRGQPKSPEHRSKLAATARRRHAATRVLHAVEAVYSAASAATAAGASQPAASSQAAPPRSSGGLGAGGMAGAGPVPSSAAASSTRMGAVRAAAYSMGLTGLSDGKTGKRLSRTQILNSFKSELREYRALQVGG